MRPPQTYQLVAKQHREKNGALLANLDVITAQHAQICLCVSKGKMFLLLKRSLAISLKLNTQVRNVLLLKCVPSNRNETKTKKTNDKVKIILLPKKEKKKKCKIINEKAETAANRAHCGDRSVTGS